MQGAPSQVTVSFCGVHVRVAMIALLSLVLQTTAAVILTRISKTASATPNADGSRKVPYSNASIVVTTECVKLLASMALVFLFDTVAKIEATHRSTDAPQQMESGDLPEGAGAGPADDAAAAVREPRSGPHNGVFPLLSRTGLVQRWATWRQIMYAENFSNFTATLKLAVPALLYTVQNNVIYIALANLEATTFQVGYQSKVVTTAVLSVLMLGRSITPGKWVALLLLTTGIVLTQLQPAGQGQGEAALATTAAPLGRPQGGVNLSSAALTTQTPVLALLVEPFVTSAPLPTATARAQRPTDAALARDDEISGQFAGMVAVMVASFCSAFAGVYFEKILKGTAPSVWVRNAQLASFSVLIGACGYLFTLDPDAPFQAGDFFNGYDALAWALVATQAIGGMVIACVVKYADNILKGFATALSIVLCGVLSVWITAFAPGVLFLLGSCLVIGATFLYALK